MKASLKMIISPAKKMKSDTEFLPWRDLPEFLSSSEELLKILQSMTYEEQKVLWKCNDQIARLNMERIQHMNLYTDLTPAILAYEGIQYQYMAPGVFTDQEYDYLQNHLRILSGFYGMLKPFDGIKPYRLEMQAKLGVGKANDLYDYWGCRIAERLINETDCIVNLASREYSICVSKYLPKEVRFITCVFGEEIGGKIREKGTMCKMARGEMVRFMAENQVDDFNQIRSFDRLHYRFSDQYSNDEKFVFLKEATES